MPTFYHGVYLPLLAVTVSLFMLKTQQEKKSSTVPQNTCMQRMQFLHQVRLIIRSLRQAVLIQIPFIPGINQLQHCMHKSKTWSFHAISIAARECNGYEGSGLEFYYVLSVLEVDSREFFFGGGGAWVIFCHQLMNRYFLPTLWTYYLGAFMPWKILSPKA